MEPINSYFLIDPLYGRLKLKIYNISNYLIQTADYLN